MITEQIDIPFSSILIKDEEQKFFPFRIKRYLKL